MEQNQTNKIGYKDVLTQKQYVKLIISNVITRFGDSINAIAFSWIVYQITQSASWSAIIFAINMTPGIILQPFTGAIVEGISKKKVMVIAGTIRTLLMVAFLVLYLFDGLNKVSLITICVLISTVETFYMPAEGALVPLILDKEYYNFGISTMSALSRISEIIGLAIASAIIGFFGIEMAMIIDLSTLIIALVIISTIKSNEKPKAMEKVSVKNYLIVLKEGFDYVKDNQRIVNLLIVSAFLNFSLVPINAVLVPFIIECLKLGTEVYSIVNIALTLGVVLGAMIFPYVKKKISTRFIMMAGIISIAVTYMCWFSSAYIMQKYIVYFLMVISSLQLGISIGVMNSEAAVLYMENVEQEYMARARGLQGAVSASAMPITSLLISAALLVVEIPIIFAVAAVISVLYWTYIKVKNVQF